MMNIRNAPCYPKRGLMMLVVCAAWLLNGCAQNTIAITVDTDVPVPVTDKLPLNAGVYYDEQFTGHVYEEDSEDRPGWRIASGESQLRLFDRVLSSMFTDLQKLESLPPGPQYAGLDIVLQPKIEEMQFSTPAELKTGFYEAWIQYELAVSAPDGSPITTWSFEGYGRSSSEFLKEDDKGMNEAMGVAMRDAGAKLVIRFQELPEIESLIENE